MKKRGGRRRRLRQMSAGSGDYAGSREGSPPLPPTDTGLAQAREFFDKVEKNVGLMAAIGLNNKNILALAEELGHVFSYHEMQVHLIERWGVTKPFPGHDFCCT